MATTDAIRCGGWARSDRQRLGSLAAALVLAVATAGCSYQSFGSIDQHYRAYSASMPERNKVFVCSAYGCRTQTPFSFTEADIKKMSSLMAQPTRGGGPAEERVRLARTLAWMERRVGDAVGTSADRPGDDFFGAGDPTQMDCVDVATNITSYLVILDHNKLLRYHSVGPVYVKDDVRQGTLGWTHYAAIIIETKSNNRFAVDGWKLASGKDPEIIEAERWYIDDSKILVKGLPL